MESLPQIFKLLIAMVFVLSLMGGLALLLKKLGLGGAPEQRGKEKRLKLIETLPLDARRRLAIIECDGKQHLVLMGLNGDTVIDKNIGLINHDKNA